MLAAVTWKVTPSPYGSGAFLVILMLAGLTFLVVQIVLGSSYGGGSSARRRKLVAPGPIPTLQRPKWSNPANNRDRRASPRRSGNPVKILVSQAGPEGEHFKGLAVNRSRGGLCLSVDRPVEVGQVIHVRAAHAPDGLPWVEMRVKRCQTNGERWRLGCQFVAELPWSVLLLFG